MPTFGGAGVMLNFKVDDVDAEYARLTGAGLQEQAPNHLKLHWSRALVVSIKEKAGGDLVR